MRTLSKIELLLVALWLGAAVFFAAGVAPSAFIVLPNGTLAGNVVNRTLSIVNFSGMIIGAVLFLLSFIPRGEARAVWLWIQRGLLLIMTLAAAAGQAIIGLYMEYLRKLSEKPIGSLPADDPVRMQFDRWHEYSVWILLAGMAAALLAFFVISRDRAGTAARDTKKDPLDFDFPKDLKI